MTTRINNLNEMKEFGMIVYALMTDKDWIEGKKTLPSDTIYTKIRNLFKENEELKKKLSIAEAEAEEESTLVCKYKEEMEQLKVQHYQYMMEHPLEAKCDITGLTTTEDDLQCSLDYGSLICESEWNKLPKFLKKTRSELHEEIDELNEKITCLESDSHNEVSQAEFDELKEENEELKAKLEWNIHEVARYSVAIEEEYVLKAEFEKLKEENEELKETLLKFETCFKIG